MVQKAMEGDTRLMIELVHLIDGKPTPKIQESEKITLIGIIAACERVDDDDYGALSSDMTPDFEERKKVCLRLKSSKEVVI